LLTLSMSSVPSIRSCDFAPAPSMAVARAEYCASTNNRPLKTPV
jgi:hypothetical protein